jgi:hypothetical protein
VGGLIFAFSGGYTLTTVKRIISALRNYRHFLSLHGSLHPSLNKFIKDPNLEEYVILPKVTCKVTPDLFINHMRMVDDYRTEANKSYSYEASSANIEAEIVDSSGKHKLQCNEELLAPFASSSLLCNIQNIQKHSLKKELTMLAYGRLRYIPKLKAFSLKGESFATNRLEINEAWSWNLSFKTNLILLLLGLGLGVGSCLLAPHQQELKECCLKGYEIVKAEL